jgi:hypothetical protein
MKYFLLVLTLMMLTLATVNACETISEHDTLQRPSQKIEIVGETVYAWYSHGGDLAKVNAVQFHFTNHSKTEVVINIDKLYVIHTNREGVEQIKKPSLTGMEISNVEIIDESNFKIPANSSLDLELTFESIDVGIFYYKSYRAIRLFAHIDGNPVTSDAEMNVMREDDDDYDGHE